MELLWLQSLGGDDVGAGWCVHGPSRSLCWGEPGDSLPRASSWCHYRPPAWACEWWRALKCSVVWHPSLLQDLYPAFRELWVSGVRPGVCPRNPATTHIPLSSMAHAQSFYNLEVQGVCSLPYVLPQPWIKLLSLLQIRQRLFITPPQEIDSGVLVVVVVGRQESKETSLRGTKWKPWCLPAPQARLQVSKECGILPQSKLPVAHAMAASFHLALGRWCFPLDASLRSNWSTAGFYMSVFSPAALWDSKLLCPFSTENFFQSVLWEHVPSFVFLVFICVWN